MKETISKKGLGWDCLVLYGPEVFLKIYPVILIWGNVY